MKTIYVYCKDCKDYCYLRVDLIGHYWILATCRKCGLQYRFEKDVNIIESE